MPEQLIHGRTPDFAWAASQGSRVVSNPVRAGLLEAAAAQVQHDVKREVLLQLAVEEKIARLRAADIARDEICVELLQSMRVGELGERAVRQVLRDERSWTDA